jgi:hypothetical protein
MAFTGSETNLFIDKHLVRWEPWRKRKRFLPTPTCKVAGNLSRMAYNVEGNYANNGYCIMQTIAEVEKQDYASYARNLCRNRGS